MVISLFVLTSTYNIFSTSFSGVEQIYYTRTICCPNVNFSSNFNFIVPKRTLVLKYTQTETYDKMHKT